MTFEFSLCRRFHIFSASQIDSIVCASREMKKLDIRLFLVLLFFGTSPAKSVTSEKVCYGFMSDYLLLDENLR